MAINCLTNSVAVCVLTGVSWRLHWDRDCHEMASSGKSGAFAFPIPPSFRLQIPPPHTVHTSTFSLRSPQTKPALSLAIRERLVLEARRAEHVLHQRLVGLVVACRVVGELGHLELLEHPVDEESRVPLGAALPENVL